MQALQTNLDITVSRQFREARLSDIAFEQAKLAHVESFSFGDRPNDRMKSLAIRQRVNTMSPAGDLNEFVT